MREHLAVREQAEGRIEVSKSVFLAFVYPLKSADQAAEHIAALKKKFYDATHVCYGYVLEGASRYSDDNEPQGTAGMPILSVLKDFDNTLLAVVRYFGGTKLGTGGLARAYKDAARQALQAADVFTVCEVVVLQISCSYQGYNQLCPVLKRHGASIENLEFLDEVRATITANPKDRQTLVEALASLSIKILSETNRAGEKNED